MGVIRGQFGRPFVAACAMAISLHATAPTASAQSSPEDKPAPAESPLPPSDHMEDGKSAPVAPESGTVESEDEELETEITLNDGRRVSGVLVERTEEKIVVRVNNILSIYSPKDVKDVVTRPPLAERYREMRAAIEDKDIDQRLRLVEWLRGRAQYQLALNEVNSILEADPDNPDARQLRTWLTAQVKIAAKKPKKNDAKPNEPGLKFAEARKPEFPVLTPDQINTIRVFEIDLADPPRMIVDRDTITALIDRYSKEELIPRTREGREALYRKRPDQILDLMYRLRARDLYSRVRVLEDPKAFKLFRDKVLGGWLLNACASTQCHGGEDAGRLWLTTRRQNSDTSVYTNFLILDRFRIIPQGQGAAGTGDQEKPKQLPLIDYENPEQSILLQLGLTAKESAYPHPKVPPAPHSRPFMPVFHNREDRRYLETVEWIKSMYRPRPDYPVDYTPPTPMGARPAEAAGPAPGQAPPVRR